MKYSLLAFLFIMPFILKAQKEIPETPFMLSKKAVKRIANSPGTIQMGVRNTVSAFGNQDYLGIGTGGQFRLKLLKRVNTEWYADYIRGDIGGLGRRIDGHIGWSVMLYPVSDYGYRKITPYLVAGHCFDYTKISENVIELSAERLWEFQERWSSAVQAGVGLHYHFNRMADMTLKAQYMSHLGKDIHARPIEENGLRRLSFSESNQNTLEGHILFSISVNITIGNLW
jgi:hypothetical protein